MDITLLTPTEVSKVLKINYNRVLELIKLGEINAIKIGNGYRILEGELFDFIQSKRFKSHWK